MGESPSPVCHLPAPTLSHTAFEVPQQNTRTDLDHPLNYRVTCLHKKPYRIITCNSCTSYKGIVQYNQDAGYVTLGLSVITLYYMQNFVCVCFLGWEKPMAYHTYNFFYFLSQTFRLVDLGKSCLFSLSVEINNRTEWKSLLEIRCLSLTRPKVI